MQSKASDKLAKTVPTIKLLFKFCFYSSIKGSITQFVLNVAMKGEKNSPILQLIFLNDFSVNISECI